MKRDFSKNFWKILKNSIFSYLNKNERERKKNDWMSHNYHQNYENSDQTYENSQNFENYQILRILTRAISF